MSGEIKKSSRQKSVSLNQDDFILPRSPRVKKVPQKLEDSQKLFKYIDDNVIGKGTLFLSPYGRRKGKSRKKSLEPNKNRIFYQLILKALASDKK